MPVTGSVALAWYWRTTASVSDPKTPSIAPVYPKPTLRTFWSIATTGPSDPSPRTGDASR